MNEFIYKMINEYALNSNEIIEMYEVLQGISKNSNLSVEEAVRIAKGYN